jgi:cyclic beta-1,2-glucan synthetase
MGSGDWNDGMNRVGNQGRGESVWVGWFLHTTLAQFAPLCEARGDSARARAYLEHVGKLKEALEAEAWDGDWYRRAYFDDGTPLGSAQNEECRIDSIAQSWAVISGAGDPHRAQRAMAAVEEHLIRRGDGLVMLFTPPFDRGALDPGYIKGYVPGVRENGGQYTHAALWVLIAYALAGGDAQVQGRALRRGRRRLRRPPAHGARRVDVVHGLGRLDVPRGAGIHPRLPPARRDAPDRAVRPALVARLRDRLPPRVVTLSY